MTVLVKLYLSLFVSCDITSHTGLRVVRLGGEPLVIAGEQDRCVSRVSAKGNPPNDITRQPTDDFTLPRERLNTS